MQEDKAVNFYYDPDPKRDLENKLKRLEEENSEIKEKELRVQKERQALNSKGQANSYHRIDDSLNANTSLGTDKNNSETDPQDDSKAKIEPKEAVKPSMPNIYTYSVSLILDIASAIRARSNGLHLLPIVPCVTTACSNSTSKSPRP